MTRSAGADVGSASFTGGAHDAHSHRDLDRRTRPRGLRLPGIDRPRPLNVHVLHGPSALDRWRTRVDRASRQPERATPARPVARRGPPARRRTRARRPPRAPAGGRAAPAPAACFLLGRWTKSTASGSRPCVPFGPTRPATLPDRAGVSPCPSPSSRPACAGRSRARRGTGRGGAAAPRQRGGPAAPRPFLDRPGPVALPSRRGSRSRSPPRACSMTLLADRTVLVVGAAGGLGAAIVAACREAGAHVLRADLAGPALDRGEGPACPVDLSDVDDACALLAAFASEHGPLDGVVNAAGVSGRGSFPDLPTDEWRRVLDIDLVAPAQLVQALSPHLRTPGASIVNLTSIESDAVYASAGVRRGAVRGLEGRAAARHPLPGGRPRPPRRARQRRGARLHPHGDVRRRDDPRGPVARGSDGAGPCGGARRHGRAGGLPALRRLVVRHGPHARGRRRHRAWG